MHTAYASSLDRSNFDIANSSTCRMTKAAIDEPSMSDHPPFMIHEYVHVRVPFFTWKCAPCDFSMNRFNTLPRVAFQRRTYLKTVRPEAGAEQRQMASPHARRLLTALSPTDSARCKPVLGSYF
ncbi:hypothetical protein E4U21_005122 [Claviceps maximensis]|nr:hypothetical protein E4U21_005122 [Claviceps maximensis]